MISIPDHIRDSSIVTKFFQDNLPHGCKVDSLEKWASTFGTVVYVHPIMERKINPNKVTGTSDVSTSTEVSTSVACVSRFFQSAFIKFVDEQSPVEFIKVSFLLSCNLMIVIIIS